LETDMNRILACFAALPAASGRAAKSVVTDDAAIVVRLAAPAKRIVSLAPHITETLFAAGVGAASWAASITPITRGGAEDCPRSAATPSSTSKPSPRSSPTW
jgi:ABC-type Fe3+-hydroxamate transport system substrate-binding protein